MKKGKCSTRRPTCLTLTTHGTYTYYDASYKLHLGHCEVSIGHDTCTILDKSANDPAKDNKYAGLTAVALDVANAVRGCSPSEYPGSE